MTDTIASGSQPEALPDAVEVGVRLKHVFWTAFGPHDGFEASHMQDLTGLQHEGMEMEAFEIDRSEDSNCTGEKARACP